MQETYFIPSNEQLVRDEDVFEALDLGYEGLEAVRAAYGCGDMAGAKHALVSYFENRTNVRHYFDYRYKPLKAIPHDVFPYYFQSSLGLTGNVKDFALTAGRKLMENYYIGPNGTQRNWDFGEGFSNEIHYCSLTDSQKGHRGKFSMFVRGQSLEYLMFLYHETGDDAVLEKYEEFLRFFWRTYPIIVEDFSASADHLMYSEERDVMDLGWLMFSYVEMLYTRITYDSDPDLVFDLIKHLWFGSMQFRRYLEDHYEPQNHHYFERGITPFFLSLMLPEFPGISSMKERAAEVCIEHIADDFNEDGGCSELSVAYWFGATVTEMLYRNILIADLNGYPLLSENMRRRIDRTFDVLYNLSFTGERLPSIGDNNAPEIDPMLNVAYLVTGNEKFRKLIDYRNGVGEEPEITKYYANDNVGFAIGKSGYDSKANGFIMTVRKNCGDCGHDHMDMLSLIIRLRGEYFVNEPYAGRLYHLHLYKSIERGYCYNMDSHNLVLCHGKPVMDWTCYANRFGVYRPDSPVSDFKIYENGMYVSGYHNAYTFCSHIRKVLFSDNGNMVVRDEVNHGNRVDADHIERWNLEPGVVPEVLSDHAILLKKGNLRYLWIIDRAVRFDIYRNIEILGNFFEDNEIGYTLDVYFRAEDMLSDRTMLVKLTVMMIDVTDKKSYEVDELVPLSTEFGDMIDREETLSRLEKVLL